MIGDFTNYNFVPNEQTCALAVLAPSASIPTSGGTAASVPAANPAAMTRGSAPTLSTPQAPLGNATLAVASGFAMQPNPLAGRPYLLLRQSYSNTLANAGVVVPSGVSPYRYASSACGTGSPDCARIKAAVNTGVASAVRADPSGKGTFPGVPPGTYYLMIFALVNKQQFVWGQAVNLNSGANSITLDLRNATPLQ